MCALPAELPPAVEAAEGAAEEGVPEAEAGPGTEEDWEVLSEAGSEASARGGPSAAAEGEAAGSGDEGAHEGLVRLLLSASDSSIQPAELPLPPEDPMPFLPGQLGQLGSAALSASSEASFEAADACWGADAFGLGSDGASSCSGEGLLEEAGAEGLALGGGSASGGSASTAPLPAHGAGRSASAGSDFVWHRVGTPSLHSSPPPSAPAPSEGGGAAEGGGAGSPGGGSPAAAAASLSDSVGSLSSGPDSVQLKLVRGAGLCCLQPPIPGLLATAGWPETLLCDPWSALESALSRHLVISKSPLCAAALPADRYGRMSTRRCRQRSGPWRGGEVACAGQATAVVVLTFAAL